MNEVLAKLKANLESADAAMRNNQNGDTPNRAWVHEQFLLVRLLEEEQKPRRRVGCEGEDGLLRTHYESETCEVCAPPVLHPVFPHGLFEGHLDALLKQKRHAQTCMENMYAEAKKEPIDRDSLKRSVDCAMDMNFKHMKDCEEFIGRFGEYLSLSNEPFKLY